MTKNETARFGLVIFNQPAERRDSYETHWLYRDRDPSKTILEWRSGGLAIRVSRLMARINTAMSTGTSEQKSIRAIKTLRSDFPG